MSLNCLCFSGKNTNMELYPGVLWECRQGILLSTLHCRTIPESYLSLPYETEDLTAGNELFCQNAVKRILNRICIQFTCSWMKFRSLFYFFSFDVFLPKICETFQMYGQSKKDWCTTKCGWATLAWSLIWVLETIEWFKPRGIPSFLEK